MTAYVTEKNNDDADHEHDAALLSLSNYIYNNRRSAIKSPHYAAILKEIERIDPKKTFLGITGIFRGITSRSAALQSVSLNIKIQLRNLMKDLKYGPEIAKDSQSGPEIAKDGKSDAAAFFEEYENEYVSNEQPLTSEYIRSSLDTDHTDEESADSDSVISAEIEDMFQFHDPEITQIKELTDYLNYALAEHSNVEVFIPRAKYMMQMTQKIASQLRPVIISVNYSQEIYGVLAKLSPEEKKQLIKLSNEKQNAEELRATKDIVSHPDEESSVRLHKK